MKTLHSESGLTLVELLVVIVLIGLIYVAVSKTVFGQGEAAKAELNVVRMNSVKNALQQYQLKFNTYPSTINELLTGNSSLLDKSGQVFVPMVDEDQLKDIWGNPYIYRLENDGRSFNLKSLGSDGMEGGDKAKQDVTVRP